MKDIAAAILERDDFLVVTHVNPDGDALGSAIGLCGGLRALGKRFHLFARDGVPVLYNFLPFRDMVNTSLPEDAASKNLILLDCNLPVRAGLDGFKPAFSIVVDHHETEGLFGDLKWIDPDIAATSQMVHALLKEMGVKVSAEIATCLYTGLAMDTGVFRHANTGHDAFMCAAELALAGAEPGVISDLLYNTWSTNKFSLFERNLKTVRFDGPLAHSYITLAMMDETGARPEDLENFVNFPLYVTEVRISALIKEIRPGAFKASLRSKGAINVARVAEMFSGGGHQNAAGCTIEGTLDEVQAKLLGALKKLL